MVPCMCLLLEGLCSPVRDPSLASLPFRSGFPTGGVVLAPQAHQDQGLSLSFLVFLIKGRTPLASRCEESFVPEKTSLETLVDVFRTRAARPAGLGRCLGLLLGPSGEGRLSLHRCPSGVFLQRSGCWEVKGPWVGCLEEWAQLGGEVFHWELMIFCG